MTVPCNRTQILNAQMWKLRHKEDKWLAEDQDRARMGTQGPEGLHMLFLLC